VTTIAVAHRAGNSLAGLRAAAALGVHIAEADVHSHLDRLEVRHATALGRLPLLRDGVRLSAGWTPRFTLAELLAGAPDPGPSLMLDLKAAGQAMGQQVARLLHQHAPGRTVLVCAAQWAPLDPVLGPDWVHPVLSVGSADQLRRVFDQLRTGRPCYAVSVKYPLLNPAVVDELHRHVAVVLAWTVNRTAALPGLLRLGTSGTLGVISDRTDVLRDVLAAG
jgi:glycerophosphoryl diester phosphodiesterase